VRCTGYKKIIEAVQLAARFIRGEVTRIQFGKIIRWGDRRFPSPAFGLSQSLRTAHFTADIRLEGALELAVFRKSGFPCPHHFY